MIVNLPKISGKKSDLVYVALKRGILLREIEPHQVLIEQSLAGQFGCSQGTIREALLRLADDGLVVRSGYRGTHVTETTLAEAAQMVGVRLSIERTAARSLAATKGRFEKDKMDAIIEEMGQAHKSRDLYTAGELDRAFHCALVKAAGMELLAPILLRCALHIHRFTHGSTEVPRDFLAETGVRDVHAVLFETIVKGTPDQAEQAVSDHLAAVLNRWSPALYSSCAPQAFANTFS